MKKLVRIPLFVLAVAAYFWITLQTAPLWMSGWMGLNLNEPGPSPKTGMQQEPRSDKVVLGGSYVLDQNEVLDGNLFILGGTAQLETGSSVTGDAMVLGGTLVVKGEVQGDLSILGGLASLEEGAHIFGNVNKLSATLQRGDGAVIDGQVNEITSETWPSILPERLQIPGWEGNPSFTFPSEPPGTALPSPVKTGWDVLWLVIRSLAWAALAVLVALFGAQKVATASDAAVDRPVSAFGMGCLTAFVGPAVLFLLIITICGIPLSLLGTFLLMLAWGFGIISIGTETGIRLANVLKVDWAVPASAGFGTFLLTLAANAAEMFIPCVGWLIPAGIGLIGLGAAILTRFGTRPYPEQSNTNSNLGTGPSVQLFESASEDHTAADIHPNQETDEVDPKIE